MGGPLGFGRILPVLTTLLHENTLPLARGPGRHGALCGAFLLIVMLHELGHAVVSKLLGGPPVLHNAFVNNRAEPLPAPAETAIALAGPLTSLVQGLLVLAWAGSRGGG